MNALIIESFPKLDYACDEAFNTLCTNLMFSGENMKKIMITSCHASEGKSFVSMNLMRTMAKIGKSVALVDADLRMSIIRSQYGIRFEDAKACEGLAHVLAGKAKMETVIYRTNVFDSYMVPVGRLVSNPLALLNSPHFNELLCYLSAHVDYVFVDAPPVGTVIDAAQIAKSCDGALMVVKYNEVPRQELIEATVLLEQSGCPIIGSVMNSVEYDNYIGRKYYYRSYYSHYGDEEARRRIEETEKKRQRRRKAAQPAESNL